MDPPRLRWMFTLILVVLVCLFAIRVLRAAPFGAARTPHHAQCRAGDVRLHEITSKGNPAFVVPIRIGTRLTVFCVDTGFAGPVLVSLPTLLIEESLRFDGADVDAFCDDVHLRLQKASEPGAREEQALLSFLADNNCSAFTAGCTMRLSSIATTTEQTSEMILTPAIEMRTVDGEWTSARACSGQPCAEIVSTTPMRSLHLLTIDWLRQNAPCLLLPSDGLMRPNLSTKDFLLERATLHSVSRNLIGGAFVIEMTVGGRKLSLTADTGAACYISIGAQAANDLKTCHATGQTVRQIGANGEHVCSRVVLTDVSWCGESVERVPILCNDAAVDDTDGYCGVAFLRLFDLCVTKDELFARRNKHTFDATLLNETFGNASCATAEPHCTERA